ncbi:MAG: TolB protein [Candidatus Pelagisphaera sp.]|jgi:TolB protein
MTKYPSHTQALLAHGVAWLLALTSVAEEHSPIGIFDHHEDVGNPSKSGSAFFDESTQTYHMTSAGENMWAKEDQFHFAWKKITGDFIVRATVNFVGDGVDPHRKIGIIARNNLNSSSAYADACVHGDTLSSLQYRSEANGETDQVELSVFHPTEIELQRKGNLFKYSAAVFGENYKSVSYEMDLNEQAYVGLFICSHNESILETAAFSNVRIVIPAPDDFQPYSDYYGSHIEVMEVATGSRKIVYSENRSLQAPNWATDNKRLIYNAEGKLYNYWFDDGSTDELNTGPQNQNNNDHVLSWGGDRIAISNYDGEDRRSTIYILPVDGSDHPKRISDPKNGHSFLHSWSRDNKNIIFTGNRNDQWDIWSIDIESGTETQITNLSTLDDGAEVSPGGKWIYFNSVRTGTMQIWKMKVNGNDQEQVTFDEYNNWFPHFSPDGKWIVYLAFPATIDPTDHPFYKKVYLKLLSTSGGVPKTIAYIYGGQGTINVPSWSPDSRHIAFVSNTQM